MLTENAEKTQDDYARMAELRSRNLQLDSEITELEKLPKPTLTIDNLARIIELWTKIPASKIRAQEYEQLLNLDAELKSTSSGRTRPLPPSCPPSAAPASAFRSKSTRFRLSSSARPVSARRSWSSALPARCLNRSNRSSGSICPNTWKAQRFEDHRLAPGYVGYDEAGQLTERSAAARIPSSCLTSWKRPIRTC